ncbi:MAG TPA: glycosyl transferase family 1 [Anaerolineaceae bacterium]|nr:MAG: Glycosyl transferase, group 1 [Methanomicrobiales archaeon 53_19]HAF61732.1 glycosyl transferase family 1 [Anaerolineaceae bacterium]
MRIVIIVFYFLPKWVAGTEIATQNIAEHLAKIGHDVHIITSHDEGLPYLNQENGFYVHRISSSRIKIIGGLSFWLRILFEVHKIKPDIVHVQALNMGMPALFSKIFLKIPYVVWCQGSEIYMPDLFTRVVGKSILKNASAIIALTKNMQVKLHDIYNGKTYVIPNGINLKLYHNFSTCSKGSRNSKNIVFVGRLHPIKGVQYLLRAMQKILDEAPNAFLTIVGDGDDRKQLERLAEDLNISSHVEFIGQVPSEAVPEYICRADIFVLPSLSESFGIVNLEAMACGLPIVASRVDGIPDVIKDGVNGYLVDAKNPDSIAEKVLLLLKNDRVRTKISTNNREEVRKYSWECVTVALYDIYQKSVK